MPDQFVCDVFPIRNRKSSYLNSANMYIGPEGASPSFDFGEMSGSADWLHYFGGGLETKNPAGNPRHYVSVNRKVLRFEDGALTTDITFDDVLQGLLIFDVDVGTTTTVKLIAFFGDSTAHDADGGHWFRNLTSASDAGSYTTGAAGPWTEHSGTAAIESFGAVRAGSRAMLTTGSESQGKSTLGEHKLSMIISGLYDGNTANIGPAEPVGHGDWPVIGLAALYNQFVAGKATGGYYRDNIELQWLPLMQFLEKIAHGLNSKSMTSGENSVIIPLNDGSVWKYDARSTREITPLKGMPKPKDFYKNRYSAFADRGDRLAALKTAWPVIDGPTSARLGIRYFTRIGTGGGNAGWAEITTDVTDGSLATPSAANMNAWGDDATDRLLAYSPVPLQGITPRVTRNPNSATQSFGSPRRATVGGTGVAPHSATWVSVGNLIDHTILAVAGSSLRLTGFPPAANEPVLAWDSKTHYWDGVKVILAPLGVDIEGYWYDISPVTGTAMTSSTTIDEMGAILARPGLNLPTADGPTPFIAANNFTALRASGALSEVYMGEASGGDYTWSVPYCLFTKGGEFVMSWTSAGLGAMSNGGQGLLIFGRSSQQMIAEGAIRDPRQVEYPRLCQWTSTEHGPKLTINDMILEERPGVPADWARTKRITGIRIDGEDIPAVDFLQIWIDAQDQRPAWKYSTSQGPTPVIMENTAQRGEFYDLTLHLLYADTNQNDFKAPLIKNIQITWEYGQGAPRALVPPAVALA